MTDIKAKALALVNEIQDERGKDFHYLSLGCLGDSTGEALCRALEAHEAFKQKVSDAVEAYVNATSVDDWEKLKTLIIPKPKPDPLVEVLDAIKDGRAGPTTESYAACLRAALEAHGLEIREKGK